MYSITFTLSPEEAQIMFVCLMMAEEWNKHNLSSAATAIIGKPGTAMRHTQEKQSVTLPILINRLLMAWREAACKD